MGLLLKAETFDQGFSPLYLLKADIYNKKGEKSGYFTLYGMILFVFLVLLDLVYTVILGIPLGVLFLIFDW